MSQELVDVTAEGRNRSIVVILKRDEVETNDQITQDALCNYDGLIIPADVLSTKCTTREKRLGSKLRK